MNEKRKQPENEHALPECLVALEARFQNGDLMIKEVEVKTDARIMTALEVNDLIECAPKIQEALLVDKEKKAEEISILLGEYKADKTILCDIEYKDNNFWMPDIDETPTKRSNLFTRDLVWNLGEIDLLQIAKDKEEIEEAILIEDKETRILSIAFRTNLMIARNKIASCNQEALLVDKEKRLRKSQYYLGNIRQTKPFYVI